VAGAGVDVRPARGRAVQLLLVVLTAVALLAPGVAEAASRATTARPATTDAGVPPLTAVPDGAARQAPSSDLLARAAPLAVVPAPTGPVSGLLPGAAPLGAPHQVAQPLARPPAARVAAAAPGAPGSRAPPLPTGT
jgi:hypothetical protein